MPGPLIQMSNLGVSFRARSGGVRHDLLFWGVKQICLSLKTGESFCLIGESGSGKSTLAMALAGLLPFHQGWLMFRGKKIVRSTTGFTKCL